MNIEKLIKFVFENVYCSIYYELGPKNYVDDYYHYIPSKSGMLLNVIKDIQKTTKKLNTKSFIDIGCGNPLIPKIFDILGVNVSKGLEFDPRYLKLDKKNYLIQGDLLTYDFKDYDILYSYNPIKNPKLMDQGLLNIMKTMKKDAILYYVQACLMNKEILKEFTKIDYEILKYIKR